MEGGTGNGHGFALSGRTWAARTLSFFAGLDGGVRPRAIVASLLAAAKLNGVKPSAWLTDVLERMTSGRTRLTSPSGCCPDLKGRAACRCRRS
jgi:hypothetical protein